MAYDLIVEDDKRRVTIHTLTCKVFSTTERQFRFGQSVTVKEGWEARKCVVCMPRVSIVTVERLNVNAAAAVNQLQAERDDAEFQRRWSMAWHRGLGGRLSASELRSIRIDDLDVQPTYSVNDNWMDEANCRGTGRLGRWLDWLFHENHQRQWGITLQREICRDCVVRAECLEQGVWGLEAWGIWGGATLDERKMLRRRWEKEGRIDVRPYRPHSPGGRSDASPGGDIVLIDGGVRRANGGRATDTSRNVSEGTGEVPSNDEAAGGRVPEVRVAWDMQGPGPDEWADEYYGRGDSSRDGSEGASDWRSTGEA